jgi:hypothetical protein
LIVIEIGGLPEGVCGARKRVGKKEEEKDNAETQSA